MKRRDTQKQLSTLYAFDERFGWYNCSNLIFFFFLRKSDDSLILRNKILGHYREILVGLGKVFFSPKEASKVI